MSKLTTSLLRLSAVLFLFMGLTAGTAWAQNYASPNGKSNATPVDTFCDDHTDPCDLATAVIDAQDGGASGATVFVVLPDTGATVIFQEDLSGLAQIVAPNVTFDAYSDGTPSPVLIIAVEGDIKVESDATLTIPDNIELRLVGQAARLLLNHGAMIAGDGVMAFTDTGGDRLILLGDPSLDCSDGPLAPKYASINNMRVGKTNGVVQVKDECGTDDPSALLITNSLQVDAGTLDMNDNNLHLTADDDPVSGPAPAVVIEGGAVIEGSGTMFIEIGQALAGQFENTHTDCFEIKGDGALKMAFDKTTDGGVCIDLDEIGAGGFSFNRAGTLFVREALQLNGSFLNQSKAGTGLSMISGARTEFWKLKTITRNLEIVGPGLETYDDGTHFVNAPGSGFPNVIDPTGAAHCESGRFGSGNESGVYFFQGVTIEGDLVMTDTDDPLTTALNPEGQPCVEGVWFLGHDDPEAGATGPQSFSEVQGDFTSDTDVTGAVGVYLGAPGGDGFEHHLAFQGDFIFNDPSPVFILAGLADAFPRGNLCVAYTNEARGSKIVYNGSDDQVLRFSGDLVIPSVQIKKDATGQRVEIHEDSGTFFIDTTLEVIRGSFVTNGKLDAGPGVENPDGATVVINRDETGDGVLQAGDSEGAYTSDADDDTPRKVKYTGSSRHFTGDEIPGDSHGSVEGEEVFLPFLEIFASDPKAVVTLGKDFTIGPSSKTGGELAITQGTLDVGSSVIRLSNELLIAIGTGTISDPEQIGERGGFDFPTQWIPNEDPDGFDRAFEVGVDGIDLLYFGRAHHTVGPEWPPSDTDVGSRYEDQDLIRHTTINPKCGDGIIIMLREEDNAFRINGDLIIGAEVSGRELARGTDVGTLDIEGNILEINAEGDGCCDTVLEVHNRADLTDSNSFDAASARVIDRAEAVSTALAAYRRTQSVEARVDTKIAALRAARQALSKTAVHAGTVRFIGGDQTDVWVETNEDRLRFDFPALEVDKRGPGDSRVTFDAEGVCSTATGEVPPNNPDIIGTSTFTLFDAEVGLTDLRNGDAGGVELLGGLDILDVGGQYEQFDGEFLMAGLSSTAAPCLDPVKPYVQTVRVGFRLSPSNMIIEDGEFFAGDGHGAGGNVEVFGNFCLGCTPPATNGAASKRAADPHDGLFSLAVNGTHMVVGDFTVGPDTDPSEQPDQHDDERNRYFLGGQCGVLPDIGGLFASGNYHFEGTGDRFDDLAFLPHEQGLEGNVFFTGAFFTGSTVQKSVWHRQDEDAFFCDVVMASRFVDNDGIVLLSNVWQNDQGTLTLDYGIIDTEDKQWTWIIENTDFEKDLAGRNNSARSMGVVDLGSRDSYFNGRVGRRVETANATGGVITGGYLFPVGFVGEERRQGPLGDRNVDFFRPLILQFSDDLGRSSLAEVDYVGGGDPADEIVAEVTADDCEFPEGGLVVDAVGGGVLTLDVLSNQFWRLEFDRIPSFDPNIRVEADELPNVFDIKSLRLIQWDCDCTHPRLAGRYDLDGGDAVDDLSAVLNDFINSVPNITQEGVDINDCQIIGIASNSLINPIHIDEDFFGLARVQLIHNAPDAGVVDIYLDGTRVVNDADFQSATPFIPVIGGTHTLEIVAGGDADNSRPLFSEQLEVRHEVRYIVIVHGLLNPGLDEPALKLVVEDDVRLRATDDNRVDFFIVHGAPRLGQVDIRETDPFANNQVIGLLANNIRFDGVGVYLSLDAGMGHNIEITTANNDRQIDVFRFELQAQAGQAFVLTLSGEAARAVAGDHTKLTIMGVEIDGDVFFPDLMTANEPDQQLPETFELYGNYPNPFNPSTTISFDLPQTAEVTVEIIDMLGRLVRVLPVKQIEAGAARTLEVGASNLASGTYFYRLIARTATETLVKTGRMMLIK